MNIERKTFGVLSNGKKVFLYILKAGDIKLCLTNFGAAWTSLFVPTKKGGRADVLLGYPSLEGYINNSQGMGVTVGRFANRIKGAHFTLNGNAYRLDANDKGNTLHGGRLGFARRLWKSEAYKEKNGVFVNFELQSPDGDCGFPGNVQVSVSYGLSLSNEIIAQYAAASDRPTPVNLTNHAYFNFSSLTSVLSHELCLYASSYVEIDSQSIPTGRLLPVNNSRFDFRSRKPINSPFDHCFALDGEIGTLRPCAEVYEAGSGLLMKVFSSQPGVQFYTGNNLTGIAGKDGVVYSPHSGFCLETQHFPDSPNHEGFPSCIFGPGRDYSEKSVFAFECI